MSAEVRVHTMSRHGREGCTVRVVAAPALGGGGRVVLVVGGDPELPTALRERLDRAWVTVLDVRGGEEADALHTCRPWPWMVVGTGPHLPPPIADAARREPILLAWRGAEPADLPGRAMVSPHFGDLVAAIEAALHEERGGVRLCIGGGVEMPGGAVAEDRGLEALVAARGSPLPLSPRHAAAVARTLALHRVPLEPLATPDGVILAPAGSR
jgi:hypothetical protein